MYMYTCTFMQWVHSSDLKVSVAPASIHSDSNLGTQWSTNRIFRRKLKDYRILHAKHTVGWTKYRGNSRNLQEVWRKVWEGGRKSDTAQVRWVMVAETQGQYRYPAVCSSICHTMYIVTAWRRIMTGKEVGLGCVSVALLWCSAPECQNYYGSIRKILTLRKIRFVSDYYLDRETKKVIACRV